MLECNNISKSFKKDFWSREFIALNDISFSLKEGRVVGFLGANGAGKTTLIKIILGFIKPDSGDVKILSESWCDNKVRSLIGYMPERPYYYQNLTGYEFLKYCGELQNLSKNKIKNNIERWASKLEIKFALDRKIKGYSKGMLQRLGFVSVLLHNPKLIILDEPLSGLDPIGRKEFKDVIKEVNDEGVSVFFSSHIVNDVEEVCDDVLVLENGGIIYNGPIKDLVTKNTSNEFEVIYMDNDVINTVTLNEENKDSEILKLLHEGHSLSKVVRKSPSLEEIVYRLNK